MTQEDLVDKMLETFASEMKAQQLSLASSFSQLKSSLVELALQVPRDQPPLLVLKNDDSLLAQLPTRPHFAMPLRLLLSWVCYQAGLDLGQIDRAKIGVSEAFLTICQHALGASTARVQALFSWSPGRVVVRLLDPSGRSLSALQSSLDGPEGGDDELGLFIISSVMDLVRVSGTARGGFQIEMHQSIASAGRPAGRPNSSKTE